MKQCCKLLLTFVSSRRISGGRDGENGMEANKLLAAMDKNLPDKDDLNIIRNEEIKAMVKRHQKLEESLKMGFATVYKQCSREVKEKLESTKEWEKMQKEQCLHKLIQKIEKKLCWI